MYFSVVPHFVGHIAHFDFKALTPIQSLVFFHWSNQNLFPLKTENNEAAAAGRAVYTKGRNPQDLKVNHFYMTNFVSLSPNALHIWAWQVENDTCSPCYPVGPLKLMFHGNVETSFPHLQHLPLFITVQVCSQVQNQCIHTGAFHVSYAWERSKN